MPDQSGLRVLSGEHPIRARSVPARGWEPCSPATRTSLAVLSGVLLALCFPNFNLGFLAWIALVPLLLAVSRSSSAWAAVCSGLITGLVFYGISVAWLRHVTVFGWFFVVLLETSFLALFAWAVFRLAKGRGPIFRMLCVALAWTSAELLRAEIPVFGFGFNLLGYSQSDTPWVLQLANAVGAYGLGFAVAWVNAGVAGILEKRSRTGIASQVASILAVLGLLCLHGWYHLHRGPEAARPVRIAVIQGNIPQKIKWMSEVRGKILEMHLNLTALAAADGSELIFWPEAAFPGYFNRAEDARPVREAIAKLGAPAVIGSPHLENELPYNSAYLVGRDGQILGRYDKQYLVPFGEYVPLKPIFGWLEPIAQSLGVSDFRAGGDATVFRLEENAFSVLICFEDTFPNLARVFVRKGASFLAVITNDAWFLRSAAPYQHLQASVFRAVENGVPVVRAANTGVSAFIDPKGRILERVQNAGGEDLFVAGRKTLDVEISAGRTLYQMGGWLFPYVALGWVGILYIKIRT